MNPYKSFTTWDFLATNRAKSYIKCMFANSSKVNFFVYYGEFVTGLKPIYCSLPEIFKEINMPTNVLTSMIPKLHALNKTDLSRKW